jgi:hypothetical protein
LTGPGRRAHTPAANNLARCLTPVGIWEEIITQKFTAPGDTSGGVFLFNWSYDCTSFGKPGGFQANVMNVDGSRANAGMQVQGGMSGSDSQTVHAGYNGGTFYVIIDTPCSWHVWAT